MEFNDEGSKQRLVPGHAPVSQGHGLYFEGSHGRFLAGVGQVSILERIILKGKRDTVFLLPNGRDL